MAKLIRLIFLFSINIILLQCFYCKRDKRGISSFVIPGINIGDLAIDALKDVIFGKPVDKDQIIIDKQLEHMANTRTILSLSEKIAEAVQNTPELTILLRNLQLLNKNLNKIEASFKLYEFYQKSKRNYTDDRIREFALGSTNLYTGLRNDILDIYSIVVPSDKGLGSLKDKDYALTVLLSKFIKGYKELCNQYKSQQMVFETLLETVTVAEFKVLVIMEYSIKILADANRVNYESEMTHVRDSLQERFKTLTSKFQPYISKASREVWRCDPEHQVEGETYFQLNRLFQRYIVRSSDITGRTTCYQTCANLKYSEKHNKCFGYKYTDGYVFSKYMDNYKPSCDFMRKCAGNLYGCEYKFRSYQDVWACKAPPQSSRRYMFVEEGYSVYRYGQFTECNLGYSFDFTTKDYTFRNCEEICLCTCDDSPSPSSDQKVNLRAATADKDHVITGIRWLKENYTLHLQIEQGKIGKKGEVDASTVHWKDIQEPRSKSDTAFMNFHDLRGFHLQDAEVAKEHVLAGVKLEVVSHKNKNSRIFTLRLLPLAYEYKTGTLNYTKPFYEDPDGSVAEGLWDEPIAPEQVSHDHEQYINPAKVPTTTNQSSVPVDNSKKMTRLTTSDFSADAGQTTVPFFDMQKNVLVPPVPLSGVGIYYKKSDGYAGYLALKLLSFDVSSHVAETLHDS